MYGLINSALRNMIREEHGEEIWQRINEKSDVQNPFLTLRSYEDDETYRLVGATAEVLDTTGEACLEVFGKYWLLKGAPEHFSSLLDATGSNVIDFFQNLDALHDRISTTFVDYRPPTFKVDRISETSIQLHYISGRVGLTPFVTGIIHGVSERFATPVTITEQHSQEVKDGEHTVFHLTIG